MAKCYDLLLLSGVQHQSMACAASKSFSAVLKLAHGRMRLGPGLLKILLMQGRGTGRRNLQKGS